MCGGTVWGWISYDPDLNLIYYGTANPGPWNPEQRPGDNKWTAPAVGRAAHVSLLSGGSIGTLCVNPPTVPSSCGSI